VAPAAAGRCPGGLTCLDSTAATYVREMGPIKISL
jgi:hypothetical protein